MSFGEDLERERERIVRLVRHASVGWAEAMRAHKLAPPDAGFADRLRKLSEAAAAEQIAWQQAHAAEMAWRPVPGAASAEPPYELRPGTGRRGPEDLWIQFDRAVSEMNMAIATTSALEVAKAFGARVRGGVGARPGGRGGGRDQPRSERALTSEARGLDARAESRDPPAVSRAVSRRPSAQAQRSSASVVTTAS